MVLYFEVTFSMQVYFYFKQRFIININLKYSFRKSGKKVEEIFSRFIVVMLQAKRNKLAVESF